MSCISLFIALSMSITVLLKSMHLLYKNTLKQTLMINSTITAAQHGLMPVLSSNFVIVMRLINFRFHYIYLRHDYTEFNLRLKGILSPGPDYSSQ